MLGPRGTPHAKKVHTGAYLWWLGSARLSSFMLFSVLCWFGTHLSFSVIFSLVTSEVQTSQREICACFPVVGNCAGKTLNCGFDPVRANRRGWPVFPVPADGQGGPGLPKEASSQCWVGSNHGSPSLLDKGTEEDVGPGPSSGGV